MTAAFLVKYGTRDLHNTTYFATFGFENDAQVQNVSVLFVHAEFISNYFL